MTICNDVLLLMMIVSFVVDEPCKQDVLDGVPCKNMVGNTSCHLVDALKRCLSNTISFVGRRVDTNLIRI